MTSQQLTLQQITDRLAEEAGRGKVMVSDDLGPPFPVWMKDGHEAPRHPFPPDSIDAAVRAVPTGWVWHIVYDMEHEKHIATVLLLLRLLLRRPHHRLPPRPRPLLRQRQGEGVDVNGFQDMILNGIIAIGILYTAIIVVVTVAITVRWKKWRRK